MALFYICTIFFIIAFFVKREQNLMGNIQKMLDNAITGKFNDISLNESKMSIIENSMWRYLCDCQMSYQKLLSEKEQIQAQISDISHQTGTHIANIILYSQLLEEQQELYVNNSETAECLSIIRKEAEELDFLTGFLEKLSRMETGIINVTLKKQKIMPVLSSITNQFQKQALKQQIQFSIEMSDESAVFDLKWTKEAVANVVDNALKYTRAGGSVSISVKAYSFFVCIRVSDTGTGIPEREQANIFTRFYRSEAASEKAGLGIGLYIAREVIKAQGGYIKVDSVENKGSCFSMYLLKNKVS